MGVTNMIKRLLALLLCLFMLPVSALADVIQAAPAVRFRLSFDMDAGAYPESVSDLMSGIADLFNTMTLEGLLTGLDGNFDLQADLLLGGVERTRTDLHLFGSESSWHIRSSLLGGETLTIAMQSLLEFALKGYSHLRLPLQRAAILASPYVHAYPMRNVTGAVQSTLYAQEGTRTVSKNDLVAMARMIRADAESSSDLRNWALAVAMETGYDDYLMDIFLDMPDWIETFVPKQGITITIDESSETWTTNALTLLRRETDLSGTQVLSVALPPLTDGSVITLNAACQPDGGLMHGSFDLLILNGHGKTVLKLHADGSVPVELPVTRDFSLTWDAEGPMVGGDGVHLRFEGEPTATGVILRQLTPDRSAVMLTVTADLEKTQADFSPDWTGDSIQVLSVSSDALNELMGRIASPLFRGLLPLIAQAPASSCQTLMSILERSGVFAMLTDGFTGDEDWDAVWDDDWEEYWGEEWDD